MSNDTPTTPIHSLSLHDALPICGPASAGAGARRLVRPRAAQHARFTPQLAPVTLEAALPRAQPQERALGDARCHAGIFFQDRKSTRLNSSHQIISYAVFCLKKKK